MAKKKAAAEKDLPFEEAMERLEEIVRQLEEAGLPLEKSLEVFEEGVRLSRLLNRKLTEAEQKVEILLKDEEGGKAAVPFAAGESEEGEDDGEDDDGEEDDSDQGGLPF